MRDPRGCSAGFQSDAIAGSLGAGQPQSKDGGGKGSLRSYVETFTPETLQEMARILSAEAATLVEMQTTALFGDFKVLQKQMEVGASFLLDIALPVGV